MFNAPFQVRYVTLLTSDNFPFNNDTIPASALFVGAAPRFGSRSSAPGRHIAQVVEVMHPLHTARIHCLSPLS